MNLLPQHLLQRFSAIGEQTENNNPIVVAHYYIPNTNWHYFAFDYVQDLRLFSGYITGIVNDCKVFHLLELSAEYNAWGAAVLDEYWLPMPFSKIKYRAP